MRVAGGIEVGADTHTGRARTSNEDDFLLFCPENDAARAENGVLFAIADGMGGVTGGAEASRAAVRALVEAFLVPAVGEIAEDRMGRGFTNACQRVFRMAREQPRLREMGTTLTALNLLEDRAVVGHVGDSRCYLLRDRALQQLTEDHALRAAEHQLTRCIGAGREGEAVDVSTWPLQPGDTFALCTDGLWDALTADEIRQILGSGSAQAAASELVRRAVEASGVDNCTAVVVRVRAPDPAAGAGLQDVELPTREVTRLPRLTAPLPALRGPWWPWPLLVLAAVAFGVALLRYLEPR